MSVMKWTMVLELEDGELSVGCNEQNFYLIIVLFYLTKVEKDSNIRTENNNNNKKKIIIKKSLINIIILNLLLLELILNFFGITNKCDV